MIEPIGRSPIFNYVVSVQGREFIVTINDDSMSQWDDLSLTGLPERIHGEAAEGFVIEVRISDEIDGRKRKDRGGSNRAVCIAVRKRSG
jgi:hypothetical protein